MYDRKQGFCCQDDQNENCRGIKILLEHKSIDCLDHFKSYMWTKMYMCVHVHIYMYIWTNAHTYVQSMKLFIYVCIWTHLLCLCQQMHLGTCIYVNVDMCINIACVHSYVLMWVSEAVFVHMHVHMCIHISHPHMYICATIHMCFNMLKSSHIHMIIYKYTHG